MRNAMNEVTRGSYVNDCELGVKRWNRLIEKAGYSFRLSLPSTRFRRNIGNWAGVPTDTTGRPIAQEEFNARIGDWLPSESDRAYILSLMHGVHEPGKMAAWIAPPDRGINNNPVEYEYVTAARVMRHVAIIGSGPAGCYSGGPTAQASSRRVHRHSGTPACAVRPDPLRRCARPSGDEGDRARTGSCSLARARQFLRQRRGSAVTFSSKN